MNNNNISKNVSLNSKILLVFFTFIFLFFNACSHKDESIFRTKKNPGKSLGIVIHRSPANYSFKNIRGINEVPKYNPNLTDKFWQVDLRSTNVSKLDMSNALSDLLYSDFDDKTIWPARLPAGFSPTRFMELGKNPGLGIRQLHKMGITGKGIGIAIIDHGLLVDHIEYKERLRSYEEIHCWDETSMHGSAVSSIAVGKTVGVAPDADLYYIACVFGEKKNGKFEYDFSYLAKAIKRILSINETLPKKNKIRVLSIAVGWGPKLKGYNEMVRVVEKVKREGILIVSASLNSCYENRFYFSGLGRDPMADPDDFTSYSPGIWWDNKEYLFRIAKPNLLLVPMDSRCTASPTGNNDYVFYRTGGLSWAIPYLAGVYALACQANTLMTPELFLLNALKTGEELKVSKDGQEYNIGKIVNPVKLIASLQKR